MVSSFHYASNYRTTVRILKTKKTSTYISCYVHLLYSSAIVSQ